MQNQAYIESFLHLNKILYEMTDYSFETMKKDLNARTFIIDPENIGISFTAAYKEIVVIKNIKLSSYTNWSKSEGYTEQKNLFDKIIFLFFFCNKLKIGNRHICLKYQNLVLCKKTQEFYWNFNKFDSNLSYYLHNYYDTSYSTYYRESQDKFFINPIEQLLNDNFFILFRTNKICYDINLDSILVILEPLNIVLHFFNHESCEDFDSTYMDRDLLIFWFKLLICIQHKEIIDKIGINSDMILFYHHFNSFSFERFRKFERVIKKNIWPRLGSLFHTHILSNYGRKFMFNQIWSRAMHYPFFLPEIEPEPISLSSLSIPNNFTEAWNDVKSVTSWLARTSKKI